MQNGRTEKQGASVLDNAHWDCIMKSNCKIICILYNEVFAFFGILNCYYFYYFCPICINYNIFFCDIYNKEVNILYLEVFHWLLNV